MVNTELLDKKIEESGLKLTALADLLDISIQALRMKRINESPFKATEVDRLCKVLGISSMVEMRSIFFTEKVDKTDTK